MKGDFSRDTFKTEKRFSRVLRQQGRVQLDADANEQTSILLHYQRTLALDLIGPFGGPLNSCGFGIEKKDGEYSVGQGRYYVDGILCENHKDLVYTSQMDLPLVEKDVSAGRYLFYLDVWERHISPLEDDSIREKALGGPDTATRAKVVWQVKTEDLKNVKDALKTDPSPQAVRKGWSSLIELWQAADRGLLVADVAEPKEAEGPCLTPPDSKFRGQENQLYRVEIHDGGSAGGAYGHPKPAFKWSRDNGSVATRVEKYSGIDVQVSNPRGFEAGLWVEFTNNGQELRGEPGELARLVKVEGDRFTLESPVSAPTLPDDEQWPTKVRRWDHRSESGTVPIVEAADDANWMELESGVRIQFRPAKNGNHTYRTGDYWLIPARVATGGIEWPTDGDKPVAVGPHGVEHHYAPLAVVPDDKPQDCRRKFDILAKPK